MLPWNEENEHAFFDRMEAGASQINALLPPDPTRSIMAGAFENSGCFAWVEDETYILHIHRNNTDERVDLSDHCYNPYFGISIQALEWLGHVLLVVYSEKHLTIAMELDAASRISMVCLQGQWMKRGSYIHFCEWGAQDLAHTVRVPGLERMMPCLATELDTYVPNQPVAAPELINAAGQWLTRAGFDAPETGLLAGSWLWHFIHPPSAVFDNYNDVYGHNRSNDPQWLPFYWWLMLKEEDRLAFEQRLEKLIGLSPVEVPAGLLPAFDYLRVKATGLSKVIQMQEIPLGQNCYFWVDWSVEELQKTFIRDMPLGFKTVFEMLLPHRKMLEKVGDRSQKKA